MVDKNGPLPKNKKLGNCWIWVGVINRGGYGFLNHNKKVIRSHRASFEIHKNRKVKDGMCVCHRCDVRKCVRPSHLFEDSQKENIRDAVKKGRMNLSGLVHEENRTLTDTEALEIINAPYYRGVGIFFAKKYNLSKASISRIRLGKAYKSLHPISQP